MIDLADYVSNGNPGGGIAQSLSLTPGTAYALSFAGSTSAAFGRDGTGVIELWMNGVFADAYSVFNPNPTLSLSQWSVFTYDFIAGSETTIEFRNRQDAFTHFANIDAVSIATVVSTPEPAALVLLATGLAGVGFLPRRGRKV